MVITNLYSSFHKYIPLRGHHTLFSTHNRIRLRRTYAVDECDRMLSIRSSRILTACIIIHVTTTGQGRAGDERCLELGDH